MKPKPFFIGILLLIFVIGTVVLLEKGRTKSGNQNTQDIVAKMPDVILKDKKGNERYLGEFSGIPLVINSWASWCPFCIDELLDFVTIQQEFKARITIIAINRQESAKVAQSYTDDLGITDDLVFLLDPADAFYQKIGGFSMPETIFVDAKGNIVEHKRGPMREDEIRQKVKNLLEE